jgi:hypothetical protein
MLLFVDNRHGSGRFSPLVGRDGAVAPHTQGRARTRSRLYRRILQPEARPISSERTDVVSRIVIADPTAQFTLFLMGSYPNPNSASFTRRRL